MTRGLIFKLSCFLALLCQLSCSPKASHPTFEVLWNLDKNIPSDNGSTSHQATFELTSNDNTLFDNDNWALYWNQAPHKPLEILDNAQVEITHINGDFYSLTPQEGFAPTDAQMLSISYIGDGFMIKESDGPLGVYLTYNDKEGNEQIVLPTTSTIGPFNRPAQLTRSTRDQEPIASAQNVYIENEKNLIPVKAEELSPILPKPKMITSLDGQSTINGSSGIAFDAELAPEFAFLKGELASQIGVKTNKNDNGDIILRINKNIQNKEGYQLTIQNDQVIIEGGANAGVFYGIQSFIALISQEETSDNQVSILNTEIQDAPAFPYRGMHIDVGRNFQSKDQILKMLDLMAMYKLNKFLFYLTEDEGWRLAIEEFPELTDVSARRGHTLDEHDHLQPAYGSGPYPDDASSYGNGFYTREDFKEILQYAHTRHIDVIPEVNFPGHARTAIKAMENRYRRLMEEGKTAEAEEYRLVDPDDQSIYESPQGYDDNVVCVCKEAPYKFYEAVLDDIIEMYKEAEVPLTMMHTGGDEVPKGAWSASPLCADLLNQLDTDEESRGLQAYFFKRLVDIIRSKNLTIGGWEEAIMKFPKDGSWSIRPDFANKEVFPYVWQNLWGNQDLGYKMANAGYPVILCNVTNFYFDLAYDKDPREPGLYWAGFNNSKHAFDFIPYDLFKSTVEDDMGQAFNTATEFKDKERLTSKGIPNIIGLQSQLWSETIKGGAMLEHYTLPKMLGFAERAWTGQEPWMEINDPIARDQANLSSWSTFINAVVSHEFDRLDKAQSGFMYRIPAPGILVEQGGVQLNTAYPGMEIRYTTDGSEPTASSPLYEGGIIQVEGNTIKAKCFNQMGRSGLVSEAPLKLFEL